VDLKTLATAVDDLSAAIAAQVKFKGDRFDGSQNKTRGLTSTACSSSWRIKSTTIAVNNRPFCCPAVFSSRATTV